MFEKSVHDLLDDFYQAFAISDMQAMEASLKALELKIFYGDANVNDSFIEYLNDAFRESDERTVFNARKLDYPFEGIFREVFKNAFECSYKDGDINMAVDFRGNGEISLCYNEVGVTFKQFMCSLVKAQRIFINVEWFYTTSNNFSYMLQNQDGRPKITELNLSGVKRLLSESDDDEGSENKDENEQYAEIIIKISDEQYEKIKDNFLTMVEKKGDFINLIDLCFAFDRKNIMSMSEADPSFNVSVTESGAVLTQYNIEYFERDDFDIKFIRFSKDSDRVVDFICYEYDGFSYLIPFKVPPEKRTSIAEVFLKQYNFFSIYELPVGKKLSAFFISVPGKYVVKAGTEVRPEEENIVAEKVEQGIKHFISAYGECFTIDVYPLPDVKERYAFRPRNYAFGFIKNFLATSEFTENLRDGLQDSVSVRFPEESTPVALTRLRETAFREIKRGVPEKEHISGGAYSKHILAKREDMLAQFAEHQVKTLYLSYKWGENREFYYEFIRPDGTYIIESKVRDGLTDYGLYTAFNASTGRFFEKYTTDDSFVEDEDALESVLASFDEAFNEDYQIKMRYYQFYVSYGDERHVVNISKVKVTNLKNAMETLEARRERFDKVGAYDETVKMLLDVFSQGKNTISFLKEIGSQGGEIAIETDNPDRKLRLCVYGRRFIIPDRITVKDMYEIVYDFDKLSKAGVIAGRHFGFKSEKVRYNFKAERIHEILDDKNLATSGVDEIASVIDKLHVCSADTESIALLDEHDMLLDVIRIDKINSKRNMGVKLIIFRDDCAKIVFLKEDLSKTETAGALERLLTDGNNELISGSFVETVQPNIILPNQVPYYKRPLTGITPSEFEFLRSEVKRLNSLKRGLNKTNFRNSLAKDVDDKLFGYGGCCPICGIQLEAINCFTVKDFLVELISAVDGVERLFKFSLYMCANNAFEADGWVIENISIGGMNPYMWIKEVTEAEMIVPEFLHCSIRMTTRVIDAVHLDDKEATQNNVVETPRTNVDCILSPLMAAKWVEDNI
jgi:hypothetical protein